MNQRTDATEYIAGKLSDILVGSEYATDIGRTVYIGNITMQEMEVPCVVLIPEDESPVNPSIPTGAISISYEIFSFMRWTDSAAPFSVGADNDGEYKKIDDMLHDIKSAIGECHDNKQVSIVSYISADAIYSADGGGNIGAQVSISVTTKDQGIDWG